jgi:hypothetical protein
VAGQVSDFRTQAGVPGALVQFHGESQVGESRATTDASGHYVRSLPSVGSFTVSVDGDVVGIGRVTGPRYRGDLLIHGGTCVSRYGALSDSRTLRPVGGAIVSLGAGTAVSEPDGWYRVDLGCPSDGTIGYNTKLLYVSHPNYAPRQQVVGRGIQGVFRFDLALERR